MPHTLSRISARLLAALRGLATVVILLHWLAPLLKEDVVWGLWPVTYLPRWAAYVLALLALVVVFGGERLWEQAAGLRTAIGRIRFTSPAVRLALSLLAGVLFYLLRIRHLRWGDAELLVKALADPYRLTYVWQAPFDVYLHERAWQLGNALFSWPNPIPVYRIFSTLAGIVFVWVLLGVATLLGRNRTERLLIAGLVLTLGTMELFCGYIENYPLMTAGVLLYTYLALLCLRGRVRLIWPAAALALTHAFHPSTIILTPSLLYLAFGSFDVNRRNVEGSQDVLSKDGRSRGRALLDVAIPYVIVFAAVVALMTVGKHGLDALVGVDFPGGGDRRWFVPLFRVTTEWEHYTMFSLGHLTDIVNEQLLVAPVVWPGLILLAALAWGRLRGAGREGVFLALMAGFYLLLTLTWNADYGGQKDWDLFSPAAIPAALLLGWLLPRALPERRALRAAGFALLGSQAFHVLLWFWQNTRPQ